MVNFRSKINIIIEYFLLFVILLTAFLFRMYKVDIPLADHHSWRQSDTAAVARNFVKEGWSFFKPHIDNMTYLGSPTKLNSQRLFLVEPPIYPSIVSLFYNLFGIKESIARIVSIFFSLGSIIFLYLISRHFFNSKVALLSSLFFSILPYSIFYSRVILPEPMIVFLTLGLFYFFARWISEGKTVFWFLSLFFAILAFTQKLFPLFMVIPLFYLVFRKYSFRFLMEPKLYFWAFVSFLPIILWRLWISGFPEGIPGSSWLLNQGDIRFKGAFFWWIFAERLGKLILGYWGLVPLSLGLILRPTKKEGWFFHFWLLSIFLYIVVFAAGNVTHDYYQIPIIPIVSIFLAKGTEFLLRVPKEIFSRTITYLVIIICVSFSLSFSWREVRDFYNIQGGVDLAGRAVDELAPKEALVLTGDSNDATLLYNTNRYGWTGGYASAFPNSEETIEKVRKLGASIYVATKFDESSSFGQFMLKNFFVLKKTNQYIIFKI